MLLIVFKDFKSNTQFSCLGADQCCHLFLSFAFFSFDKEYSLITMTVTKTDWTDHTEAG